jgi:CheY-like chemotaxis protein
LRQILLNLISNAVKFTERGEVTIAIAVRPETEPPSIRIDVVDSGIGMAETTRQRVFEKFTQADSSVTRRFGGTGLGLAISRELVELMDGQIGVASRLGEGSLFWVELPLPPADSASAPVLAPAPPMGATRPLRVLLAEDNKINQKIVRAVLAPAGHAVDIVSNGAAAVDAVQDGDYDVVLMDVQMPILDGPEATRQIRLLPPPAGKIHIIALTAHAMVGARDDYLDAGMDDYLTKPIDQAALLGRLAKLSAARR